MKFVQSAVAAALLALSGTAGAQLTFHEKPDPQTVFKIEIDADRARQMMNAFGRCVAKKRKAHAEALLAMPYGSPEQAEAGRQIVVGVEDCVPRTISGTTELRFQPDTLVGGLAEELVRARVRKTKGDMPALAAQQAAAPAARNGAEEFGHCVVGQDMAAAYSFVTAKIATAEEEKAAAALRPHLASCVLEGQTLALNKATLRVLLSVSLYQALSREVPAG